MQRKNAKDEITRTRFMFTSATTKNLDKIH